MAIQPHRYQAYMLRLWQVTSDSSVAWRASLEDPHTGERKGFPDLESLVEYLKAQATMAKRPARLGETGSSDE